MDITRDIVEMQKAILRIVLVGQHKFDEELVEWYINEAEEHEDPEVFIMTSNEDRVTDFLRAVNIATSVD